MLFFFFFCHIRKHTYFLIQQGEAGNIPFDKRKKIKWLAFCWCVYKIHRKIHRKFSYAQVFFFLTFFIFKRDTCLIEGFIWCVSMESCLIFTILGGVVAPSEPSLSQLLWIKVLAKKYANLCTKLGLEIPWCSSLPFISVSFRYNLIHLQTWFFAV